MKSIGSHIRRGDPGFTIIESLVALFVLVVGILSTFTLVDAANSRSAATRAGEGATNLARELTEQVRTLRFSDLTTTGVTAGLQAKPGLADASSEAGWQITRRGYTFTIAPAVCSIDDPKDKFGDHAAGGFCADSATTGIEDAKPEDFRRVHMNVSWSERGVVARTARLSATVSSTGQSTGMPVSALWLRSPTSPGNAGTATDPVIVTTASPLTFAATAPSTASSLIWTLDGQVMGPAAVRAANGTDWTFSWDVSARSDGYYTIGAQAVDANGVVGPERTIKVQLLRSVASAPTGFVGGYNTVIRSGVDTEVAEFRWLANPERNVVGYRVYRPDGSLVCPANTATLSLATSCIDFTPVSQTATNRTYAVAALYHDTSVTVRESARTPYTINPPTTQVSGTQKLGLKTTTLNTGDKCRAGTQRDMEDGFAGGPTPATFSGAGAVITFCSPPYAAGDTLPAQTITFQANVTYTGSGAGCGTTAQLQRNGAGGLSDPLTIKSSGLKQWSFTTTATSTLNAGDRLNLTLSWGTHANCTATVLSYAGSPEPGGLIFNATTTKSTRPSPPTGLSAVTQADGTVRLSWTAPSDGSASFYRIYKAGREYTQRMPDTTGSGTETTYVDTDPQGTNDYYVTSVNPTLTESDFAGPVRP